MLTKESLQNALANLDKVVDESFLTEGKINNYLENGVDVVANLNYGLYINSECGRVIFSYGYTRGYQMIPEVMPLDNREMYKRDLKKALELILEYINGLDKLEDYNGDDLWDFVWDKIYA